jgi:hypothetical protein
MQPSQADLTMASFQELHIVIGNIVWGVQLSGLLGMVT